VYNAGLLPFQLEGPYVNGSGPANILEQFSAAATQVVEASAPAIVSVRISRPGPVPSPFHSGGYEIGSAGSGVVVEPNGLVLTNSHVVSRAKSVTVTFIDGMTAPATVIGVDDETDLAVLRVDASALPHLHWTDPQEVRPGLFVMALGRPGGGQIAVTTGIVSATGRTLRTAAGSLQQNVIQTSAALSPGTSGGALVDAHGRLVGLNVAAPPASSSVAFAIPAETARWVAERLLTDGKVARSYLGFAGQATPVSPRLASGLGLDVICGVSVEHLDDGGPAEQAGLCRKDVIVEIASRPVHDIGMVQRIVAEPGLQGPVKVVAIRSGRRIEFKLEPRGSSPVAAGF
jgi:S1-C subfamily serine protease